MYMYMYLERIECCHLVTSWLKSQRHFFIQSEVKKTRLVHTCFPAHVHHDQGCNFGNFGIKLNG